MSFFTSYVEVKTSLPNDATNDIIHYCYTKNNFVSSRNMIEFNSPSSIRLNEAKAISLIYLQVVCNRGRKHRKSIKLKAEIQKKKKKSQIVFSEKPVLFQSTSSFPLLKCSIQSPQIFLNLYVRASKI